MNIKNAKEDINYIKKIVVWITLLFMPLSTYATFIEGITVGDILLMLGTAVVIFYIANSHCKLNKVITADLVFYILFILIHSLIFWLIKSNEFDSRVLGVMRYILYIFWVCITAKDFFDFKYAYKIYKFLAIIFGGYCIMQFVAYYVFKVFLPINVLGLPTVNYIVGKFTEEKLGYYISNSLIYRPYSVFIEPSYFAAFQIPILYIILNHDVIEEKTKQKTSIFLTISLLASMSTTGMVLLILCWIKPIINNVRKNYSTIIIIIIVLILVITICSINPNIIKNLLSRVINEDGTAGESIIGRFGNYHILFDGTFEFGQLVFGQGMWVDTEYYLPSYGSAIISFGILGLFYIILMLLCAYIKGNEISKSMIILMLIMFIGTNTLFNITSVLMFTLIYSNMKKDKEIKKR